MTVKKKGKENIRKEEKLQNFKDLERNVLNEIADEIYKNKPKK